MTQNADRSVGRSLAGFSPPTRNAQDSSIAELKLNRDRPFQTVPTAAPLAAQYGPATLGRTPFSARWMTALK